MQPYLKSNLFYEDEARLLFRFRSHMYNVKRNFSKMYLNNLTCRLCHVEIEDQKDLMYCEFLKEDDDSIETFKYIDIYSNDLKKSSKTLKILKKKIKTREQILDNILEP